MACKELRPLLSQRAQVPLPTDRQRRKPRTLAWDWRPQIISAMRLRTQDVWTGDCGPDLGMAHMYPFSLPLLLEQCRQSVLWQDRTLTKHYLAKDLPGAMAHRPTTPHYY